MVDSVSYQHSMEASAKAGAAMELSTREQIILQAVVHTYITTAEPVGSRTIVKRLDLDLSPATVRNVMADLEEAGFLEQVHASSGRVPTIRGYRYYVDFLMRVQELTLAERSRLERELSGQLNDADEVMRQVSHLLALATHHAGIVEGPRESAAVVRNVELMLVPGSRVAVLLADNYGRIRTVMATPVPPVHENELPQLRNFLNEALRGTAVNVIHRAIDSRIATLADEYQRLAAWARSVAGMFPREESAQVYLDGAEQLFEQPEFRDVEKAREVFALLGEQDRLLDLLRAGAHDGPPRTSVVIGGEASGFGLDEVSVVASPYCVDERPVGMIGVLGPRRMPYSQLAGVVEYTAGMLSRLLARLAG